MNTPHRLALACCLALFSNCASDAPEQQATTTHTKSAQQPTKKTGLINSVSDIQWAFAEYSDKFNKDITLRDPSPEGSDGSFLYQAGNNISIGGERHADGSIKTIQLYALDNGSNSVEILAASTVLAELTQGSKQQADSIIDELNVNSFTSKKNFEKTVVSNGVSYNFSRSDKTALMLFIE